ncbi:hypothetical protein GI584_03600 [Gracilibacillus salitolerans]|uniref:Uncharacterized protein n=1 Tax=Gracilibacillus salitolerans TaxID=2663022 RepID=A0A5Q2TET3_9BACI|nr:hypothetical protein [Gracilibacillus salitolerans]QGH33175.1 hypothetical protein GI584_03600 [Gracilibacillus salitolerans]
MKKKMGIYRTACYKVEDVFIKMLTRKQNSDEVREKVEAYRTQKEIKKQRGKQEEYISKE